MNLEFWYDSNACFGMVRNTDDLIMMLNYQIDPAYGVFKTIDEFLDKSKQSHDGTLSFGTRIEHRGEKSLREFLKENDSLDDFLYKSKI